MPAPEADTEDESAHRRMTVQAYEELLVLMTNEEVRARALGLTKTADAMRKVIAGFVHRNSVDTDDSA